MIFTSIKSPFDISIRLGIIVISFCCVFDLFSKQVLVNAFFNFCSSKLYDSFLFSKSSNTVLRFFHFPSFIRNPRLLNPLILLSPPKLAQQAEPAPLLKRGILPQSGLHFRMFYINYLEVWKLYISSGFFPLFRGKNRHDISSGFFPLF